MLEPPQPFYDEPRPPKRLYFGQPINVYDTPMQAELLRAIAATFKGWEIFNPGLPEHGAKYEEYKKTRVDDQGKPTGMGYFFEEILPTCRGGVFLPFRDDMFGKGVFGEALWLFERKFPIWQISHHGVIFPIQQLDEGRCLTREQTQARIRDADDIRKPY